MGKTLKPATLGPPPGRQAGVFYFKNRHNVLIFKCMKPQSLKQFVENSKLSDEEKALWRTLLAKATPKNIQTLSDSIESNENNLRFLTNNLKKLEELKSQTL